MGSGSGVPQASQSAGSAFLSGWLSGVLSYKSASLKQLREFAEQGDDNDVRAAFGAHADRVTEQISLIRSSFDCISDGGVSQSGERLAWAPAQLTNLSSPTPVVEEQTLHHILAAYAGATGAVARLEALAELATSAGNTAVESLARAVQSQDRRAVETYWHFLSTRSKLAYNMLTISEIDPAVETKVADDRLLS